MEPDLRSRAKKRGGPQPKGSGFQYVPKTQNQPNNPQTNAPRKQNEVLSSPIIEQDKQNLNLVGENTQSQLPLMTLYTAGYGGFQGAQQFIQLLQSNSISILIDVRISPYSGFDKDYHQANLKKLLEANQIEYRHYQELGNVFKFGNDETLGDCPYAELITTGGEVLTRRLRANLASTPKRICIMCACKDFKICHRTLISTYLNKNYEINVVNLCK